MTERNTGRWGSEHEAKIEAQRRAQRTPAVDLSESEPVDEHGRARRQISKGGGPLMSRKLGCLRNG